MNLTEVKAIITGANRGIGFEIARALEEEGAEVVISGRDEEAVKKAADELGVHGCKADVTSEEEVEKLFAYGIEKMGSVNVLVNNAGVGRFSPLTETSIDEFQKQWEVNTRGVFLAGREAAKHFKEKKYGNIINMGSSSAVKGSPGGSAYVSSKFAVSGLTECWRAELRPFNIRVMQVNPSEVITDFHGKAGLEHRNADRKLKSSEVAHVVVSMLAMNDVGFIPSAGIWATNPWGDGG